MKPSFLYICVFVLSALFFTVKSIYAQGPQKQLDIYEQAEQEADRLQRLLDLEDWQVFFVDSTLKYNLPAMKAEFEKLSSEKVSNGDIYMAVQDKWLEKTDSAYLKIFNEEQWKSYLKSGAAKMQKARAKRKAKKSEI